MKLDEVPENEFNCLGSRNEIKEETEQKTGQVLVGLAHEGSVPLSQKNTFVVWEPRLNIYFILFLVFVVIAATEIHHL